MGRHPTPYTLQLLRPKPFTRQTVQVNLFTQLPRFLRLNRHPTIVPCPEDLVS